MLDLKRRFNFKNSTNIQSKKDTHDKWGYFEFNFDFDRLVFAGHNSVHFYGAMFLSLLFGFKIGYGFWFAWELFDGIKPWWFTYKATAIRKTDAYMKEHKVFPGRFRTYAWKAMDFIRENGLYSDKFSMQDAFIWDLYGALAGLAIREYIIEHELILLLTETAKGIIQNL